MKEASFKEAAVVCDAEGCGWRQEIPWQETPEWLGKLCPDCGKCVLITEDDLAAWRLLDLAVKVTNAIDPDGKLPRIDVRVSTAGWRRKDAALTI